jgi:hypothetical protein
MANLTDAFDLEDEDATTTVTLPAESGEGVDEYEVILPTPEQLILFASSVATPATAAAAIMEIIEDIFAPADYQLIRRRLRLRRNDPGRLHFEALADAIGQVMEAVGDFPTPAPSASSPSRTSTGKRSTGRVRSTASGRPNSVSAGSST